VQGTSLIKIRFFGFPSGEAVRRGRFKKYLVSKGHLLEEAPLLFPKVKALAELYGQDFISGPEFVAEFSLTFLKNRHSHLWKGSRLAQPLTADTPLESSINIFNNFALRGIPIEANRALIRWNAREYPLRLFFRVPEPLEVLDLQCEGFRCITAVVEIQELQGYVNEDRDPLGFVIHDLIHADKFYRDPERLKGQLEFYREMKFRLKSGVYDSRLNDDPLFKKNFLYLISDMNSHPAHMWQTLEAVLGISDTQLTRTTEHAPLGIPCKF